METRVITKINCETTRACLGYWHPEREEWIELQVGDNLTEACDMLHCSDELLTALIQSVDVAANQVASDLLSIWRRLDKMESDFKNRCG